MGNKYLYGKVHHVKYPYKNKIATIVDGYRKEINKIHSDMRINNILVDIRNEMYGLFENIYHELSMELKHNIKIESSRRKMSLLAQYINNGYYNIIYILFSIVIAWCNSYATNCLTCPFHYVR
jgi:hypothetical protein